MLNTDSGLIALVRADVGGCAIGKVGLLNIDSTGSVYYKKSFGASGGNYYVGASGSFIKTIDSGYVFAGNIQNINGDIDIILFKFDKYGDSLWCRIYADTINNEFAAQVKQLPNGDLIICGDTDSTGNDNGLIMKTDSAGNILWKKIYGNTLNETFASVDIMQDGGFICGGWRNSGSNYTSYIVKIDATGNLQWQQLLSNKGGGRIAATSDGGAIVACAYIDSSVSFTDYCRLYLIKLSSTGSIQWQQKYGPSRWGTFPWSVYELPDSSYIVAGNTSDSSNSRIVGLVDRIDVNGNQMFYRSYKKLTGPNSENYLRDIKQTPDGGFVACGFVAPLAPDTGTQDMWVIKLDSMGCDTANCQTNTGIFNHTPQTVEVTVYPNPATNSITISTSIYLQNTELIIYDLTGKEIYRKQEDYIAEKTEVDISAFPQGIYMIELKNNYHRAAVKFIKQ